MDSVIERPISAWSLSPDEVECAVHEFKTRLRKAMDAKDSLVCVGLDPQTDLTLADDIFDFNRGVIDATAEFVAAYKPQSAFYEAAGDVGWAALKQTIEYIREAVPHALIILDVKRGDVPNTAEACARMAFGHFGADAATVNPYVGGDGAAPFLQYPDRGAFFLCRTSNPGSGDLQSLRVCSDSTPGVVQFLYEEVALQVAQWGKPHDNAGVVVGATYPHELRRVRELCNDMPILVPGIGAQGGDLSESVSAGLGSDGFGLLINSSRSLIYSPDPGRTAEKLRHDINVARQDSSLARNAAPALSVAR